MGDDAAPVRPEVELEAEAEAAELATAFAAQSRERAVRLARVSRLAFGLGVAMLVLLVVVWVLGAVATSDSGFRLLALGVVVLVGLAFLTGALSAAAERRTRATTQPKNVRPTS